MHRFDRGFDILNPSDQYALIFLPGLLTGRMFDLGIFKVPFAIASVVLVASCFIAAECTKYWHFLLVQGIVLGVSPDPPTQLSTQSFEHLTVGMRHHFQSRARSGRSLVQETTRACVWLVCSWVCNWWNRLAYRGTQAYTNGWVRRSEDITFLSLNVQNCFHDSFKWTMRILGFILLVMMAIPNLTLSRRLPAKRVSGGVFNWRVFKTPAFSLYSVAIWTTFVALYTGGYFGRIIL